MSRLCRLWAIEPRVRSASGCGRSLSFLYAEAIADEWTEIVATVDHAWALPLKLIVVRVIGIAKSWRRSTQRIVR